MNLKLLEVYKLMLLLIGEQGGGISRRYAPRLQNIREEVRCVLSSPSF
jgi:hypothetical protein